jgi:membrane protease YdiL (CAAX protease family)
MNEALSTQEIPTGRRLLAPLWHTALLIAILLAMAAYGMFLQRQAGAGPQLVERRGSALPLYLSLIVAEWGLLRLVVAAGLKRNGVRFRDLLGERWAGPRDVLRDIGIAVAFWATWTFAESVVLSHLGHDAAKGIDALLPRGPAEIAAWIALSISAGFCEEAIFRGYLQKQFQALTGSAALAVLIQAVVFGISHGYQGVRNVILITTLGAAFGALALWRKSLKPGMVLHAWTDVFSGIFAPR